MEYSQIFKPSTLAKLNKKSQENLKTMLGDKTLMQTMIQSQELLDGISKAEAPYKEQLEQLAIQMIEDLYPIVEEEGIRLDAKIVPMGEIHSELDEIKVNNPSTPLNLFKAKLIKLRNKIDKLPKEDRESSKEMEELKREINSNSFEDFTAKEMRELLSVLINEIKINNPSILSNQVLNKVKHIFPDAILQKDWLDRGDNFFQIQFYKKNKPIQNVDRLDYDPKTQKFNVALGPEDWNGRYFKNLDNALKYLKTKKDTLQEQISPEGRRRVINAITQGSALRGAFSFYLFKDYLDAIDPSLIDKYNQIMKNSFGVYDDDNAISLMLSQLAQNAKSAGGSSKVIINESQESGITIKARALNFPMLVHELIKGLYELVSLQGFKGDKEANQGVVDKVDKLKHEPHDIKFGKHIFDALNDIFANSPHSDPRIREFFFSEVYQLEDDEFLDFVENAINEELTPKQKRWVDQTLKEISSDLKSDDYDQEGIDEIKVNNPINKRARLLKTISGDYIVVFEKNDERKWIGLKDKLEDFVDENNIIITNKSLYPNLNL